MPVTGATRPFGSGPFGFASFGTWRIGRAAARAMAAGAAGGSVSLSRLGSGRVAAAAAAMGGALNPKASGSALAAQSAALGGIRRDRVLGAHLAALSGVAGGVARTLGATGQARGQSALRGRVRQLWDRPDGVPAAPAWGPGASGSSGPWLPSAMPGAPAWVPQPPAEH